MSIGAYATSGWMEFEFFSLSALSFPLFFSSVFLSFSCQCENGVLDTPALLNFTEKTVTRSVMNRRCDAFVCLPGLNPLSQSRDSRNRLRLRFARREAAVSPPSDLLLLLLLFIVLSGFLFLSMKSLDQKTALRISRWVKSLILLYSFVCMLLRSSVWLFVCLLAVDF